jgi:hypothetical protein
VTHVICDLYGLVVACRTRPPELAADLMRPFRYFERPEGTPGLVIDVEQTDPPYASFPTLRARFSTPRNIVYQDRACKIVDYFGRGVVVQEPAPAPYRVYGRDPNFLREAVYLLVTARFGQHCDRHGLLRVHALALSHGDTALLLPMPPGSGKSTLALALLDNDAFKLLSEDDPVVDASGAVRPFPIRIGTLDARRLQAVPARYVYSIDRMEFGPKHFVDVEYWRERIEHRRLRDVVLFVSERVLNGRPAIRPASRRSALASLVRDAVIGIGLYQGLEFMLSRSSWEIVSQAGTVSRRLALATRLALAARTYHMSHSGDVAENARVLSEFMATRARPGR